MSDVDTWCGCSELRERVSVVDRALVDSCLGGLIRVQVGLRLGPLWILVLGARSESRSVCDSVVVVA